MDRPYDIYSAPENAEEALTQASNDDASENPLASRWLRLVAAIFDGIIVAIPTAIITFLFISIYSTNSSSPDDLAALEIVGLVINLIAGLTFFGLIHGFLIYSSAQTLGKRIFSMQVVDAKTYQPVTGNRYLFVRYIPITLIISVPLVGPFIGLINALLIFRRQKNCLHDDIAKTRVINLRGRRPGRAPKMNDAENVAADQELNENPYAQS